MGPGTAKAVRWALTWVACVSVFGAIASSAQAYVYWTDNGPAESGSGTALARVNLDGKGEKSKLVDDANGPAGIATNGTWIVWANYGTESIGRVRVNGTDQDPTLVSHLPGSPYGVATAGPYVYWTWNDESNSHGYVGRANLNGSDSNPEFIDLGSSAPARVVGGIAVSAGTLYVGEYSQVAEMPAQEGASASVFDTTVDPGANVQGVAVADGHVFWSEAFGFSGSPQISWAPTNKSSAAATFVSDLDLPAGVASDGKYVYWADNSVSATSIGRALITPSGASDVNDDFISDSRGPFGVAVDSDIDPTTTTVSCSPPRVSVGSPTVCTATVADHSSTETPTGTVTFGGSSDTFFPGGNSCTLTTRPGGAKSCTVGAESSTSGARSVTALYSGNPTHQKSTGHASFCAGTASACAHRTVSCRVPQLKGKTLSKAQQLLSAAHCSLGTVTKPKHRHHGEALVVGSQSPDAGQTLPQGTKVAVRLTPAKHKK